MLFGIRCTLRSTPLVHRQKWKSACDDGSTRRVQCRGRDLLYFVFTLNSTPKQRGRPKNKIKPVRVLEQLEHHLQRRKNCRPPIGNNVTWPGARLTALAQFRQWRWRSNASCRRRCAALMGYSRPLHALPSTTVRTARLRHVRQSTEAGVA